MDWSASKEQAGGYESFTFIGQNRFELTTTEQPKLIMSRPSLAVIAYRLCVLFFMLSKPLYAPTIISPPDSLNRLTNAAYSDGSRESYSYDAAGNRLSRVTVRPLPPTILTQPRSRTNVIGSALMLSVTVTGDSPLYYEWQKDGQPVYEPNQRTHVITNVQPADAGNYRVIVSNAVGF